MALGFQDCCNSASYFYLNGIPATVSEFETYYITTSQGENFCATYVDVPPLNYQPPTYSLLEMTEYTDCDDCKTSNSYTCPTSELILINQVSAGSVAVSDCRIVTIMPLYAECVSVNPTVIGSTNGSVSVFVTGGTPPYLFYSGGTNNAVGNNQSSNNVFSIFQNLPEGVYNVDITDSNNDFLISLSCVLDASPSDLTVSCIPTNASIYSANDGSVSLNVAGGTPPYTYTYLGSNITLPLSNLVAGNYTITVTDSGTGDDLQTQTITCTVTEPALVDYPDFLCLKFTICGTAFTLQLEKDISFVNYRPIYYCNNPEVFGLGPLSLFYGTNGWTTSSEPIISQPSFNGSCGISFIGQTFLLTAFQPTSSLPIGSWVNAGALVGATGIIVTAGICPVTALFVSAENYCTRNPNALSSVVVSANGGTPPYYYNVYNNFINQSSSSPTFSLPGGSYSLLVSDALGTQSSPVSFTVNAVPAYDVLFGADICGSGGWGIEVYNPDGSNIGNTIENGETRIMDSFNFSQTNWSSMPNGATFTAKIKITLVSQYRSGGDSNFKFPNTSSIFIEPFFTTTNIITNGITSNFMNGVTAVYPPGVGNSYDGTNGVWYYGGLGSSCCPNPNQQGLLWNQNIYWITTPITFNNTSLIDIRLDLTSHNSIPLYLGTCGQSNPCGGYLNHNFEVRLVDIVPVTGCIVGDGEKVIQKLYVNNNSNSQFGFVDGLPVPFAEC